MSAVAGFYGFQSITANIAGAGGNVDLAYGSGAAEEGITIEPYGDQSTVEIGADGFVAHSLSASTAHTITARLSKVAPGNRTLQIMANLQQVSPALNGKNIITLRDTLNGNVILCEFVAFTKYTPLNYAKDAGINEWQFVAARVQRIL